MNQSVDAAARCKDNHNGSVEDNFQRAIANLMNLVPEEKSVQAIHWIYSLLLWGRQEPELQPFLRPPTTADLHDELFGKGGAR